MFCPHGAGRAVVGERSLEVHQAVFAGKEVCWFLISYRHTWVKCSPSGSPRDNQQPARHKKPSGPCQTSTDSSHGQASSPHRWVCSQRERLIPPPLIAFFSRDLAGGKQSSRYTSILFRSWFIISNFQENPDIDKPAYLLFS